MSLEGTFTTLFAFVLMLGPLIFVHELGHFLVAKACGVRVLKFSMGFGSPIGFGRHRMSWKRGTTEYVVAWFPLGGFVKMLGENPDEVEGESARAHPSETLGGKPTWQKLAIVFAGPAMNLLLPVVVFATTLAIGMPRADSVVGTVEAGSPAASAGLMPGDRISAVEGEPVRWWGELDEAVRARSQGEIELTLRRGNREERVRVPVASRSSFDEFGQIQPFGWIGLLHQRPRALLGIADAASAAHAAGLRSGDLVKSVDGGAVEDWYQFAAAYAAAGRGGDVVLQIARGPGDAPAELELSVPALGTLEALGALPATVLIGEVEPDSAADRAGLVAGDLVLRIDGAPAGSFESFAEAIRTSGGEPLALVVARGGVLHQIRVIPEIRSTDLGLGMEEERYRIGIRGQAMLTGSVGLDRTMNPLVSVPRAVGMTVDVTRLFLRGVVKLVTGEVPRNQVAGPIGIAQIAGDAFERGWETFVSILVLISINLGILNLLPIPVLDGGQALVFMVEAVKRGPLSLRTREFVQQVGLTVLILLIGFAFWNDLVRLGPKILESLRGTGAP